MATRMTEQEVFDRLSNRIPQELGQRGSGAIFGIGQKILDALKDLVGGAGVSVDVVVAAAKRYYDQFVSGNNPSIPDFMEGIVESLVWMGLERAIRRMFARQTP